MKLPVITIPKGRKIPNLFFSTIRVINYGRKKVTYLDSNVDGTATFVNN